jgi:hypothetical protein
VHTLGIYHFNHAAADEIAGWRINPPVTINHQQDIETLHWLHDE